jgi:hypothetical protein
MLIATNLAACMATPTPQPAPARTPAPLPSGATALTLATAAPEAVIPVGWTCPGNTVVHAHVVREGVAVIFVSQDTGQTIDLVWPRGFSAWLQNGEAEVVAPDGTVVLHEGQVFTGIISGVPDICEVNGVGYPPAS